VSSFRCHSGAPAARYAERSGPHHQCRPRARGTHNHRTRCEAGASLIVAQQVRPVAMDPGSRSFHSLARDDSRTLVRHRGTHDFLLATHPRPSYSIHFTLCKSRAQGRPGARRPHGPRAKENARGGHHRFGRDIPALPARMVRRLIRTLPGDRLFCPRRPRARRIANLTSAPGGQDHTISPCASVCSSA
jgi:hypothetical protein